MSEPAPERPARGGGGNFLTRKVGPLPTWGWVAVAAGGAGLYFWWKNRQGAQAATAASATGLAVTPSGQVAGTDQAASIATLEEEIQMLQGEMSKMRREDRGEGGGPGGGGGGGGGTGGGQLGGGGGVAGGGGKGGGGGSGPPTRQRKGGPQLYRHVSTGKETFNQIVKARHTTIGDILALSRQGPESQSNVAELERWARHPGTRRSGVVYFTENP